MHINPGVQISLYGFPDCHELHLQGVELSNPQVEHRLELTYDDGSQKKREVICRHDDRHTNHQLIDNHINADPDEPVRTVPQTISGMSIRVTPRTHDGGERGVSNTILYSILPCIVYLVQYTFAFFYYYHNMSAHIL